MPSPASTTSRRFPEAADLVAALRRAPAAGRRGDVDGTRGITNGRQGLKLSLRLLALVTVISGSLLPGSPAVAERQRKPKLSGESTLAEWKAASADARSELSVAIARKRLGAEAAKLDVAKAAMEITGCVSATARDSRFDAWKVEPTAATCLDAPERPAKNSETTEKPL